MHRATGSSTSIEITLPTGPVKPFHIHCPSCSARLRVDNAEALGQILCCPKCQSLVQVPDIDIDAAAGGDEPRAAVSDSQPDLSHEQRTSRPSSSEASGAPPPNEHADPLSETAVERRPLPSADWTPAGTRRARQWVSLLLAAGVGVTLAIISVGRFLIRAPDRVGNSPPVADSHPLEPRVARPTAEAAPAPSPATEIPPDPQSVAGVTADPSRAHPGDAEPSGGEANGAASHGEQLPDIPPLTDPTPPPIPQVSPTTPLAVPEPARPSPPQRAPPRKHNVETQLQRELQSFEIEQLPLIDFARLISGISHLPVTLDLTALQQRGQTPLTDVSARLTNTNLQGVLDAALEPLELTTTHSPLGGVVIGRRLEDSVLTEQKIDVGDLAGEPSEVARLGDLVRTLIAPDSWSVQGGSGTLQPSLRSLSIRQSAVVHEEIARFFGQLRQARRLARQSPRRTAGRLLAGPLFDGQQTPPRLGSISLNFSQPTRLLEIIKRLEQETETRLLFDWESLAGDGWYTDSRAALVVDQEPLDVALERLLAPTRIGFRDLSTTLRQVTTREQLTADTELVFYRLGQTITVAQAAEEIRRLSQAIGPNHFRAAGGHGAIGFDAPSVCLIVRLAAHLQDLVHHQLRPPRDF